MSSIHFPRRCRYHCCIHP